MRPALRLASIVVIGLLLLPALIAACPLCKDAKSDTDYPGGTASLPSGFYYSILLMVSAPFLVVAGLALRIYLSRRRRSSALVPEAPPDGSVPGLVPDTRGARP